MSRSVAARRRLSRRHRPTHRAFALTFAIVLLTPFQSARAEDASPELIQPLICSAETVSDPRLKGLCEVTPRDDPAARDKQVKGDKVKVNLTVNTGPIEVGGYRVVTEHYNNSYLPPIVRARPGDAVAAQLTNLLAPRQKACKAMAHAKSAHEDAADNKPVPMDPATMDEADKKRADNELCENPTNLHYFHGGIVSPQNSRRDNVDDAGAGKDPDNVTGDNVYVHLANGVDADGKARRFNFNVPIPDEGELDARVLEGEGMIAHPPGLNWYHSHLHRISSDQVMGGMSGLLSVGEDDANVKAACKNPVKDKCENDVAWDTAELRWKTDVRYALLRDIMLRDIKEIPESANGAGAIWAPELRDFKPQGDPANREPRDCPVWRKGSSEGDNDRKLRKGYCQPKRDQAWLFTLNGQRFPTITVGGNRNLLLRLGNLSANVAYWLELYNEKYEEKKKRLTILALDGVVPARPVPAEAATTPVDAIEDDSLLLMPASRAEIYVRNDDEPHDDEQVYILRTKGLNAGAGADWWPEIQLARIVLKPNRIKSDIVAGLNAPIARVEPPPEGFARVVAAAKPGRPDGCVRDLDRSKKEHRRVTFSEAPNADLGTEWSVKTEIVSPPPNTKVPVDEDSFMPSDDDDDDNKTTIGPVPFEAYKNDDGRIDWTGERNKHVCVRLEPGGNSHKQLWVLKNETSALHNFHIHQMKFRLAKASELCERGIQPPPEAQTCPEPPKECPRPNQKLYIDDLDKDDQGLPKCGYTRPASEKLSDREWHDTIPMPVNRRVFLIMSFDDKEQLGRFVFHCHILKHEDKGLMAPIEVWDDDDL